jgi:CheY-like chemotaxis protein
MKIAICDNDKNCNKKLHAMLTDYTKRNNIDNCEICEYTSGEKLLIEYAPGIFDVIFLDVEMPCLDGFETARKIREVDLGTDIVFVTYMKDDVQRGERDGKGSEGQVRDTLHKERQSQRRD